MRWRSQTTLTPRVAAARAAAGRTETFLGLTENARYSLRSWPVTASVDLHRDDWLVALRSDTIHRPGHPEETFARVVLEHPGAVIVLAVDHDEQVACVRQYRHPATGTFLELPAGLRNSDGEDPLETAKRELLEEVELEATEWRELFALWPSAGPHHRRKTRLLPGPRPDGRRPWRVRPQARGGGDGGAVGSESTSWSTPCSTGGSPRSRSRWPCWPTTRCGAGGGCDG